MSTPIVPGSALSDETHRLLRGILQREGIDPSLQAQTESICLHWIASAKRESDELRKGRLMEAGLRLNARYKYLIEYRPWRDSEIANVQKLLDAIKAEVNPPASAGRTA